MENTESTHSTQSTQDEGQSPIPIEFQAPATFEEAQARPLRVTNRRVRITKAPVNGEPAQVIVEGRRSYTLSDIARGTRISLSHISRIFSGARGSSLNMLFDISRFLDVSMDSLHVALREQMDKRVSRAHKAQRHFVKPSSSSL